MTEKKTKTPEERIFALKNAYYDLVINGEISPDSEAAIEIQKQYSELVAKEFLSNSKIFADDICYKESNGMLNQIFEYQNPNSKKTANNKIEDITAFILGTVLATLTIGTALVILALYIQGKFQENNINFEMF